MPCQRIFYDSLGCLRPGASINPSPLRANRHESCACASRRRTSGRVMRPLSTIRYVVAADIGQTMVPNQQGRAIGQDFDVEILINSGGLHDL